MLPEIINAALEVYSEETEETTTETTDEDYYELAFDFATGQFLYENGEPKKLTEKEDIVKQWIIKVYNTQRGRWKVYEDDDGYDFGFPMEDFIGQSIYPADMGTELIKSETESTLLEHEWIESVTDMTVLQVEDRFYQRFTVGLTDGTSLTGEGVV
jgi:hypothetical protein